MGAVQHAAHQGAELRGRLVAAFTRGHEAVERLFVVGVHLARVALGVDVLQQLQQPGEAHFLVDHGARAQLQQGLLAVRAQLAQVLAHHDLERERARQAQLVHQARARLEVGRLAGVDQHRGGHACGGGHFHVGQAVDDAPVAGHAALAIDRGACGDHLRLVHRLDQLAHGAAGARAIGGQAARCAVVQQAEGGLEEGAGIGVPALQAQAPAVGLGVQRGDVHGHLAQVAQRRQQHLGFQRGKEAQHHGAQPLAAQRTELAAHARQLGHAQARQQALRVTDVQGVFVLESRAPELFHQGRQAVAPHLGLQAGREHPQPEPARAVGFAHRRAQQQFVRPCAARCHQGHRACGDGILDEGREPQRGAAVVGRHQRHRYMWRQLPHAVG